MPNPREQLRALLAANVVPAGSWQVLKYARAIDPPPIPTVMIRLDQIERGEEWGTRVYRYALIAITGKQTIEGAADDELEDVVEDVLLALDKATDGLAITTGIGKRGVYAETMPAFEIPIEVKVSIT